MSTNAHFGTPTSLAAWDGVWLYVTTSGATTVTVTPPGSTTASASAAPRTAADGWTVPIIARTAGRTDKSTLVGVWAAGAATALNPPALPGSVDAYLVGPNGARLAADLRQPGALPATWDLMVETSLNGAEVALSLPDLTGVPADLGVTLTDGATGRTYHVRTTPQVTFRAVEGSPRQFRLAIGSAGTAPLALQATAVQQGGFINVSYVLSAEAEVSAVVRNLAGRPVRQLVGQRSTEAGLNTLQWNLASDAGTLVPSGRYMLELEATNASGGRVRALTAIAVSR